MLERVNVAVQRGTDFFFCFSAVPCSLIPVVTTQEFYYIFLKKGKSSLKFLKFESSVPVSTVELHLRIFKIFQCSPPLCSAGEKVFSGWLSSVAAVTLRVSHQIL